jgi:hypothetical protein
MSSSLSLKTCALASLLLSTSVMAAPPAAAPAPAEPFAMKPGMWETVVANETPGVDAKRATTSRACFTAADIASTQQALPRQADFGAKCSIKDYKLVNNVATWSLNCTTKTGTLSGPGTITYKAAEFTGSAALVSKDGGKSTKVNQTLTGKRLSDCK